MVATRCDTVATMRLLILGDDSAVGHGARGYNGWAAQLGKLLNHEYGLIAASSETLLQVLVLRLCTQVPIAQVMAIAMPLRWGHVHRRFLQQRHESDIPSFFV